MLRNEYKYIVICNTKNPLSDNSSTQEVSYTLYTKEPLS